MWHQVIESADALLKRNNVIKAASALEIQRFLEKSKRKNEIK